ncbi:HU family DNA-binding protein [Desulfurispirillum indicum]|uniref:Histone family protein DNA-binding protein n=1 Tax=Desulfurispirillum indicum (strain ATCC BAA-1389 / DSM 22839 / S5) TaxID=653733 RepID=E6W5L7_DESIS|nr:HU family DNA-binding protein [Desulfurispirillum indicum]ADU66048.1 histone family protein DNA-binding protein [Desulfurispirillum indicum S5]UCZ55456.1 HU family DNA-binding protein [Desulfurispirillum indicum]
MTKKELIGKMAEASGITKVQAEKALNAFIDSVSSTLKSGEKVTLVGFGTFQVSERAKRQGINPRTKTPITIPARKSPKFVPGKALKELVDK